MMKLDEVVTLVSGSPQFRILEVSDLDAPLYTYFGQRDLEDDLVGIDSCCGDRRQARTFDGVNTLCQGDVVFSLISGKASLVSVNHEGYLFTQNYVKLVDDGKIDSKYLVYILNEDKVINNQLQMGLQGSQVLKYTLKQVKALELPVLPTMDKQRIIGKLYFNQLRLEALRTRVASMETTLLLARLREVKDK